MLSAWILTSHHGFASIIFYYGSTILCNKGLSTGTRLLYVCVFLSLRQQFIDRCCEVTETKGLVYLKENTLIQSI